MSLKKRKPAIEETIDSSRRALFMGGSLNHPVNTPNEEAGPLIAQVGSSCISISGVACQICRDICEPSAITFQWKKLRTPTPEIQGDICTGCGECISTCPSNAISLVTKPEPKELETRV